MKKNKTLAKIEKIRNNYSDPLGNSYDTKKRNYVMEIYLAPMEGHTGYIVRNAFFHHFNGIDKYFTPFIPYSEELNKKTIRDILPSNNEGLTLIPQLMSNRADEVLYMADKLFDYGYSAVNINLGCPSGTVTSKKRGSGLLAYPDMLDCFLYEIYEKADFPVSIKTRTGYDAPEQWPEILSVYKKYPISELIIHPRIRSDFYKGTPRMEAFDLAVKEFSSGSIPLCYNGDIWSISDYASLIARYPGLTRVMIGRGLLANPMLSEQIKSFPTNEGSPSSSKPFEICSSSAKERFLAFHNEIFEGYTSIFSGKKDVIMHMKEIWYYLGQSFADSEKYVKKILKSQNSTEYGLAVRRLFEETELNI